MSLLVGATLLKQGTYVNGPYTVVGLYRALAAASTAVAVAGASNAGTSPPAPVVASGSTDMAGSVTFGTGSSAVGTGAYLTVTFPVAKLVAPIVMVTAINQATAIKQPYVLTVGTGSFQIGLGVAGAVSQANTIYAVAWELIG